MRDPGKLRIEMGPVLGVSGVRGERESAREREGDKNQHEKHLLGSPRRIDLDTAGFSRWPPRQTHKRLDVVMRRRSVLVCKRLAVERCFE